MRPPLLTPQFKPDVMLADLKQQGPFLMFTVK